MKLHNRILSTLLAVIMLLGTFGVFTVGAAAADEEEVTTPQTSEEIESTYVSTVFKTPEDKVYGEKSHMQLMLERDGYQLYVDPFSGEIATVDVATKKILFSNPYDVASSVGSALTKKELLSQIVVQYWDNGIKNELHSFEEAAMRQQISVLSVKNGVRVEYTIGREESRKLVPRQISETNYMKFIYQPIKDACDKGEFDEFYLIKFDSYFEERALSRCKSERAKVQLLQSFPVCEFMDIRTFSLEASQMELNWCENYIKTYCEDYSFEQMDADHEETGYVATDEQYPVFKMALEYTLDKNGLKVRMPCNGLRYDMATYTLEKLSVLPYMGAGNSENPGYNFYPDGSGSLFDYEQLNTTSSTTLSNPVYGQDFAYHQIHNASYQKTIRYPVYGSVATETLYTFTYSYPEYNDKGEATGNMLTATETVSNTVMSKEDIMEFVEEQEGYLTADIQSESYKRGFVAIIESGESLASIETYHAGALSDYNSVKNYFNPKPKDSYDISDVISVTESSEWTVVSERKFTGSITIRYRMLTDEEDAKAQKEQNSSYTYYETSWLGMAEAYRDYLVSNGTLQKLTADELEENIPLYLEVFGTLETLQTIMTVPVNVMTPLTTFDNILTMYNELSADGVKNINFKMTGFANGGMYSTIPSSVKWEKAVGGKDGLAKLLKEAQTINAQADKNIGLYPDFDFAYVQKNELFDSLFLQYDAIKTIDNRYSSKRLYSATQQSYVSFFQLAISPSRYNKFYTKFLKNYEKYGLTGISIGSLGTALNSDFDEDDPYNREDGKDYTVQAFQDMKNAGYSLMTEGSNAYTWKYVDHIINVDLDSSRYVKSSASVPFIGVVLHGYVQFAGTPFNEEGDTNYAILRALENGAGMYFILSYQNTAELKEDITLSQYYSVRYDIWKDDVVSYYNELNTLLKDVQDKEIIGHNFLVGERVLDLDELEAELKDMLEDAAEAEKKKQEDDETSRLLEAADAWKLAEGGVASMNAIIQSLKTINSSEIARNSTLLNITIGQLEASVNYFLSFHQGGTWESEAGSYASSIATVQGQLTTIKSSAIKALQGMEMLKKEAKKADQLLLDLAEAKAVITRTTTISEEVRAAMITEVDIAIAEVEALLPQIQAELDWAETVRGITKDGIVDTAFNVQAEKLVATGATAEYQPFLDEIVADYLFTKESIYEAGVLIDGSDISGDEEDDLVEGDKYVVDNNQIVVVTYGNRNAQTFEKTAYKSFILNYNNFAVRVTYEGVSYTIPSGEYVEVYHNN